jgi:hypothetical protein
MGLLEKLLSRATSNTVKTETFLAGIWQPALAGLFFAGV